MAYVIPEVADFRARFPEFDDSTVYPDAGVQTALDLAVRQVDETWLEADYAEAIMQLAAHLLSASGVAADTLGQDDLKSISIGPLSLTYGERVSVSGLKTTLYGQSFADLRRKNIPAVLTV